MTDLEELFRPLIDDSSRHREPVATIEARARDRRSRRRARAQYRAGAGFLAVALIATAVGILHARNAPSPHRPIATTTPPVTSNTPTVAVPAGWTTYDYGLARLSIPPGWTTTSGCSAPRSLLLRDPSIQGFGCGAGSSPSVEIEPLTVVPSHRPFHLDATVNGIGYEASAPSCLTGSNCRSFIAYVPALRVDVSFDTVDYRSILATLTYSTYARVLGQLFGAAPASWKTIALGGYEARVPRSWTVVRDSNFCKPVANTVYIESAPVSPDCPPPGVRVAPPGDSAQFIRADDALLPDAPPLPTGSVVVRHNGLRFARSQDSGGVGNQIHFTIDAPHGRLDVTLTLGLDPAVARGILGSLKMP